MKKINLIFLCILIYVSLKAQYTPSSIQTPNGSSVEVGIFSGSDMTNKQKEDSKNFWLSCYNNRITYISEATYKYNCHAFAWHVSEGGNYVWINTPNDDKYWEDYSYIETYNHSKATKVSFGGPCYQEWTTCHGTSYQNPCDHSAITTNVTNYFVSKWGASPRFMHHKNDCPYSVEDLHYYVRPIISGTSIVCNQATYSIANLPAGASVTYTLYWNSGLSPKLTSNFPEPTMCLIENTHHYPATGTLKASINIGTGNPIILTKTITTDSNTEVQSGTYEQDACNFHGVYHSSQSGSLPSTVSTPVFLHQGCMTRIKLNEMSGRTVTYTGIEQPLYWNYQAMNNTLYLQLPLYSGGVPFTFKIKGDGACKDKTLLFFSYSNNSKYTFAVAPNPVKDVLTIYAHPNNELIEQKGVDLSIEELEYDIAIYNVNMPKLLHCEKGIRGQKERKVNVAKLRKGYYILQIKEKEEIQTLKFFKE